MKRTGVLKARECEREREQERERTRERERDGGIRWGSLAGK